MRVELAKILLRRPDFILLDEPTNHLDIESIQWLEDFLSAYPGGVLIISHDRAFLDSVTNRTIELSLGKIFDYKVSYSQYVVLKEERITVQNAAYGNQQKLIVGRELAKNPAIIVAAQPTRGLDIGSAQYIRQTLVDMREKGRAILLVSADLDEVLAHADRVAIMYEGKFMIVCSPDELTREKVGMLMGGVTAAKETT